jgi:hypothetical protein
MPEELGSRDGRTLGQRWVEKYFETIDDVYVRDDVLELIDGLCVCDHVREVPASTALAIKDLRGTIRLYLSGDSITDELLRNLAGARNVELVSLSSAKVTDKGLEFLGTLENVRSVTISASRAVSGTGLRALANCQKLRLLDVSAPLSEAGLAAIGSLTQLEKLTITDSDVQPGVEHLLSLKRLEKLELWRTNLSDDQVYRLADLTNLSERVMPR